MHPLLVVLEDGEAHTLQHLRGAVADMLGVSEEEQEQLLPSGKQTTYSNRIAWALTHMCKAKPVSSAGRRGLPPRAQGARRAASADSLIEVADELLPSESIGRLVEAADDALADELLDRILAQPPAFLERLALRRFSHHAPAPTVATDESSRFHRNSARPARNTWSGNSQS